MFSLFFIYKIFLIDYLYIYLFCIFLCNITFILFKKNKHLINCWNAYDCFKENYKNNFYFILLLLLFVLLIFFDLDTQQNFLL